MPRYFFHTHDSRSFIDKEGTELPDLHSARDQAIETAGALLRESPDSLWAGTPWRMEVTDEGGELLFTADFALRQAKPEDQRTSTLPRSAAMSPAGGAG